MLSYIGLIHMNIPSGLKNIIVFRGILNNLGGPAEGELDFNFRPRQLSKIIAACRKSLHLVDLLTSLSTPSIYFPPFVPIYF